MATESMNFLSRIALALFRKVMARASLGYMAGPTLEDAVGFCRTLHEHGFPTTIGYWEPGATAPELIIHEYLSALDALGREIRDGSCMVKIPSLRYRPDLLDEVVARGRSSGTTLVFDSIFVDMADPILAMVERVAEHNKDLCFTLPARWPRSVRDAARVAELGIDARVITGIWADPQHPAHDMDRGFLDIVDQLAGKVRQVGIATHNPAIAREAVRRLSATSTRFELQVLFGMPMQGIAGLADALGVPLRVYVPYGNPLPPGVLLGRIRRNPGMFPDAVRRFIFGAHLELPAARKKLLPA